METILNIPLDIGGLVSFVGAIIIAALVGLYVKVRLKDWRDTPYVIMLITVALMTLLRFGMDAWRPSFGSVAMTVFFAVCGAALETWGYETIVNKLGQMGHGNRTDDALDQQAVERLSKIVDADVMDKIRANLIL